MQSQDFFPYPHYRMVFNLFGWIKMAKFYDGLGSVEKTRGLVRLGKASLLRLG